jgi:uncharacterized protein YqcC (DUF446 family)
MQPSYDSVQQQIDAIEAEMKRAGYCRSEPLPPEAYNFRQAFAMDTMPFSSWLQFIFIPRVRSIIAEHGEFPQRSMVGAQAVREFDGDNNADRLVSLLNDFDSSFDG